MSVINTQNSFSVFFNNFFEKLNVGHEEGVSGRDTGSLPPSATNKRFIFFITGIIRSSYNALNGNGEFGGAVQWLQQTRDNLDKGLNHYRDENGDIDMDLALTNPRILKMMDYIDAQEAEVDSYQMILDEALDAYKDVTRTTFDMTTLTVTQANPARKVELSEEDKAAAVKRLERLMTKAS